MLLTIFKRDGTQRLEIEPNDSSTQVKEIQGDNVLALSFTSYAYAPLNVNDYCDYNGERYWLMEQYIPNQKSTVEWEYNVRLYGIESLIKRFLVLETTDGNAEPSFTLTAPAREHVAMIVKCINQGMGTEDWKVGEVVDTDNLVIDYDGKYCDEALKEIADKAGEHAEWWSEGQTINICRCEQGEEIQLTYAEGLTDIEKETNAGNKFYTRLFPIGSSRNIDPEKYGSSRLQLPDKKKFVELHTDEYGIYDHFEKDAFADIYPRRVGTVSSMRREDTTDKDGKKFSIYYFKDDDLPFDPNEYELAGEKKRVSFQDGDLAGMGTGDEHYFEVNYDSETKEFEVITQWPYDDKDMQLPGGELVMRGGDNYILWNIRMPKEYYTLAEQELAEAVDRYNQEQWLDISVYKASTDHVWMEDHDLVNIMLGQRVKLVSTEFFPADGYRSSRITKITRKVNEPGMMDIEISDALQTGTLDKVNDRITDLRNYTVGRNKGFPDLIRSWDKTLPTDTNVFSARRSVQEFLNKKKDDQVNGNVAFQKNIKVLRMSDLLGGVRTSNIYSVDGDGNKTFEHGPQGKGWAAYTDANGGVVEADTVIARKNFIAVVLDVQKEIFSGGNINLNEAGGTVCRVYGFDDRDYNYINIFAAKDENGKTVAIALFDKDRMDVLAEVKGKDKPFAYKNSAGEMDALGMKGDDNSLNVLSTSSIPTSSQLLKDATYFRVYFTTSDGDVTIKDLWHKGDMAMCKDLNLIDKDTRAWHRVVLDHGTDILDDGRPHNYITLANSDEPITVTAEDGTEVGNVLAYDPSLQNSVPKLGDKVVQYGSVSEIRRMGVTRFESSGDGTGGMYVVEGVGKRVGTPEQFKPTRTPIVISPNKTRLTTDELYIATRDENGEITGEKPFCLFKIILSQYKTASDQDKHTCSTYFKFTIVNNNLLKSDKLTVKEIREAGLNIRAKKDTDDSWVDIMLPDENETLLTDAGLFTDYPRTTDGPSSITLQIYDRAGDYVIDEEVIPIVMSGTNGTSVSIKGHAIKVLETMAELDSELVQLAGGFYLVQKNETESPESYHWIGKIIGNAMHKEQAAIGDGYIDTAGDMWVAVDTGWQNVGKIQGNNGENGKDAISIDFTPAQLIVTEIEKNSVYEGLNMQISVKVRAGEVEKDARITNIGIHNYDCVVSINTPKSFSVKSLKKDITQTYLMVTVAYGDINITQRYDIYVNRLGTWSLKAMNDTMMAISTKGFTYTDAAGVVHEIKSLSEIQQTADNISLQVTKMDENIRKTGLNIEDGTITLQGDNVVVQNSNGSITALIDDTGKLTSSLIDAVKIVTSVLQAENVTARHLHLQDTSQFGKMGTDENGNLVNTADWDTTGLVIGQQNIKHEKYHGRRSRPSEKPYQEVINGNHILGGGKGESSSFTRMNEPVIPGFQMIGKYIDVAKASIEMLRKGMVNAGVWVENGVFVGFRPMLRYIKATYAGETVQLNKHDTVILIGGENKINIKLPAKADIQNGQLIVIRCCSDVRNTIECDATGGVNGDGLYSAAGISHGSVRFYIYDEINDIWWSNTAN